MLVIRGDLLLCFIIDLIFIFLRMLLIFLLYLINEMLYMYGDGYDYLVLNMLKIFFKGLMLRKLM